MVIIFKFGGFMFCEIIFGTLYLLESKIKWNRDERIQQTQMKYTIKFRINTKQVSIKQKRNKGFHICILVYTVCTKQLLSIPKSYITF